MERYRKACAGTPADPDLALVAVAGADVAGYVLLYLVLDEVTILNIAVAPPHQGQGLGRQLLQAALRASREHGARRCLLEVRASNRAALALYEGEGFIEDGVRKDYYPAGSGREDALLMSKEL
jgi:ribosomal-protein-alanine N-acetyltransferase